MDRDSKPVRNLLFAVMGEDSWSVIHLLKYRPAGKDHLQYFVYNILLEIVVLKKLYLISTHLYQ